MTARCKDLSLLSSYLDGNAPLPEGADGCKEAYAKFQKKSRTNFSELIVEAVGNLMVVKGFRTGADGDENGDREARRMWNANDLDMFAPDVHADMLGLRTGYVMVGAADSVTGVPLITREDPRQVIIEPDPERPTRARAGLKMFQDEWTSGTVAYVYLPGEVWVARSKDRGATFANPGRWNWDEKASAAMPFDVVPLVEFRNRRGMGEFESHLDVLDRINHMVLQRLIVATTQAFRQRALKGDIPDTDDKGNEIDYNGVFPSSPGALWQLPEGVELWESQSTDLTPLLAGVKDDIAHLAAVTQTPMFMLHPEGANQSAEGASAAKNGLESKAEDRIIRAPWNRVMSLAFLFSGDEQRANILDLKTLWKPVRRYSLQERADAASKAGDLPFRERMTEVWQFDPEAVDRMESSRALDQLLAPVEQTPAADVQAG